MSAIQFTTIVGPDGAIRPPEGITLPEGEIEVVVRHCEAPSPSDALASTRNWLLKLADDAEAAMPDLPSDMAENHDYYAHGKPRP